ncbi:MAG: hypothetical protein CEN88_229 [Candidatus Berkelbacteria bacterium Licking1014_2]|uniref:Gcp-like domain-containing protein n=1 Tax=Candidatus Berkelbacteria bacterium Licking1014_2 TaxID=2017146 RepID=A0A554LVW7_9BACT|nr:MAG: hypothetical protein CEN88_229 [Candidatus Berkelbacteria bacterium Licking1014_2]
MILIIDTSQKNLIRLKIVAKRKIIAVSESATELFQERESFPRCNVGEDEALSMDSAEGGTQSGTKIPRAPARGFLFFQSEQILPACKNILSQAGIDKKDLTAVAVVNRGAKDSSFTGLRLGVAAANALALALDIPVTAIKNFASRSPEISRRGFVKPLYHQKPNISIKSKVKTKK